MSEEHPSSEPLRVGIIGAGGNTRLRHIPGLREIPGVEIHGVVNRSAASSRAAADEFGIPKTYADWREACEDEETDAIVIGTWPYLHARATNAALEMGKHVLVEARMAMNLEEAREMHETAAANPDLVAQIVPAPFSFRIDATMSRLLDQGYLGDILAVEIRGGGNWIDHDAPFNWRQDRDLSGLNTMMMGIYYETLMRWIGHAKSVVAMAQTFVKRRRDADGRLHSVRVPDHLNIIAEMACGAQAVMTFSSVTGQAGKPRIQLYGSEGTLMFEEGNLYGCRKDDAAMAEIEIPADEAAGWRVEQEFINAIRGEEEIRLTTFADGVKYMEFTEAVALSIQNQQVIPLPI